MMTDEDSEIREEQQGLWRTTGPPLPFYPFYNSFPLSQAPSYSAEMGITIR